MWLLIYAVCAMAVLLAAAIVAARDFARMNRQSLDGWSRAIDGWGRTLEYAKGLHGELVRLSDAADTSTSEPGGAS